ncbi:S8 family serine peptidase [Candidatus Dojkabacteria bacterium]|jgi:hypothetical protein|nr:S8 family serine peptidase [Candidatus Dojkabacteria bacterium]
MKGKILIPILLIINMFSPLLAYASGSENEIDNNRVLSEIRQGEKVDISETLDSKGEKGDRFVILVKSEKYSEGKKSVASLGGTFSFLDNTTYGKAKAIPVDLSNMSSSEKSAFLSKINSDKNVLAIASSKERKLTALPSFNDPLFPLVNSYDDSKQWYLSQPASGNYGIDIKRAWQYLDDLSLPYGGSSNAIVAVIDTGGAYESYSKYNQYEKLTTPTPWVFSKSTDFTSSLFDNAYETADNQIDDDGANVTSYCIDANENGQCDTGEMPGYTDDKNGLNIYDWGKYWSRASYSDLLAAPVCTNEPFHTNEVKCVATPSYVSLCQTNSLPNYDYYGCYSSDMGHPNDTYGHGTFVANIISATPNNSIAGVGIAPGISLLNIKVFGETYDVDHTSWVVDNVWSDQIASAISYAVNMNAKVINMSFAGSEADIYEQLVIDDAATSHDVLFVGSSGNSNTATKYYPAAYDNVMAVGASNKNGSRTSYSNYGSWIDMVAPVGSGILSESYWKDGADIIKQCSWDTSKTCIDGDPLATPSIFSSFGTYSLGGTSFSAPQVAAVAGLLRSTYPSLLASEVKYILKMSALPSGSATFSTSVGSGVLNAYNAVQGKDSRGTKLDYMSRVFQGMLSTSGYPYLRYSDNGGVTWSSWIKSGSTKSAGNILVMATPVEKNSVMVNIMKGSTGKVLTRYAGSFGFTSADDSLWSAWVNHGYTTGNIASLLAFNNLIIAFKGTDNKIYTKYSSDGGATWTLVTTPSNKFLGNVSMASVNDGTNVVQSARGSDSYVYSRTSGDSGATWSAWTKGKEKIVSDPQLFAVGNNIVRAVRTAGNILVVRVSTNNGATWVSRAREFGNPGISKSGVTFTYPATSTISMSYLAGDNKIYTKVSTDAGVNWSKASYGSSFPKGVYAKATPRNVASVTGTIVSVVLGSDSYVYYRYSTNNGLTWSSWRNKGSIKTPGNITLTYINALNRVLITVRGTNDSVYYRFSDDLGKNWNSWVKNGTTYGGVSAFEYLTNVLDYALVPPQ